MTNDSPSALRAWRGDRTLDEVAALLQTTPATISRLERGEQWVSRELALRIRDVTGIQVDDLLPRGAA